MGPTQRQWASLRLQDGGEAFPAAALVAPAAFLGSWAQVFQDVARVLGVASVEGFRSRCPDIFLAFQAAEAALRAQGALEDAPLDWGAWLGSPAAKRQGAWSKARSAASRAHLLATLDEDGRLALRGTGGPGAGSWLLPRQEGDAAIPDDHYRVSLRMRLHMDICTPWPAGAVCQHRRADGSICGAVLDSQGWRARQCGVGCSRTARHDSLRDWHGRRHRELTGHAVATKQRVPAWDRVDAVSGDLEEARLDLATRDAVAGTPVFVDWSVTCEYSAYEPRRRARSNKDGLAAAQQVAVKRARYPPAGGGLGPYGL